MSFISTAIMVILLFAIFALVLINFVLYLFLPLNEIAIVADIFNKTAIGFGAIMAGLGGFAYLESYIEKEEIKMRKRKYEKLYPKEQFGEDKRFNVIQKEHRKGKLYIHDNKKRSRRHIGNYWETYIELGWDMHKIVTLPDEVFDKLSEEEEPIIISGRVGK